MLASCPRQKGAWFQRTASTGGRSASVVLGNVVFAAGREDVHHERLFHRLGGVFHTAADEEAVSGAKINRPAKAGHP